MAFDIPGIIFAITKQKYLKIHLLPLNKTVGEDTQETQLS